MLLFKIWFFFLLAISSIDAVEIRGIIRDSLIARVALTQASAVYQGDYAFNDTIYAEDDFNDEFFRVRQYLLTRWKQKSVVVVHKVKDPERGRHQVWFEGECDSIAQAESHIPLSFSKKCFFFRRGWEYILGDMRVFVEEIEGLPPSVEVIAASKEEIFELFDDLKVSEVLTNSVPEWYCKSSCLSL